MKSAAATIGLAMTDANRECTASRIHSRPPREPSLRGWIARAASVTGAPGTSSTGTAIVRAMCAPMCAEKRYSS
jgi:hypothetical protein